MVLLLREINPPSPHGNQRLRKQILRQNRGMPQSHIADVCFWHKADITGYTGWKIFETGGKIDKLHSV